MAFDLLTARPYEPKSFDVSTARVPEEPPDTRTPAQIHGATQEPFKPGPVEKVGRYLADWGTAMRAPMERPAGGPTGVPLVDAAAGVADFATSAVADTLGAVPRIATNVFRGARGAEWNPDMFTRQPTTPVGQAIQETAGGVFKPVGDALNATGMDPNVAAAAMDVGGTALDLFGLGVAGKGAKSAVRAGFDTRAAGTAGAERAARTAAAAPGAITPNNQPLRPFGSGVERARRMGFRVLPSQVAARAQAEAPVGVFGAHHKVPGTMREGLTGRDLVPQAIIDNQKRVNAFAAKELGITEITPQALALAKNPHNAVFNEVSRVLPVLRTDWELGNAANAIGEARRTNPLLRNAQAVDDVRDRLLMLEQVPTQQALDAIRSYRQDAARFYKQADLGVTGSIEAEQAAQAYRAAADALENAIERQVGILNPDMVPRVKDARTALAKIHNVEDALDGNNVDPQALVKASQRYPLTGYLAEIADVAREFPQTMASGTGVALPSDSYTGALMSPSLFARRTLGREQGPMLLRDDFQNRFGREDPNFDPRPAPTPVNGTPFSDYTPPDPNVPGGPGWPMPPVTGPDLGPALIDPMADFEQLPEAAARPGDLTASTPPVGGSIPAQDLGLAEALAGPMDITPQTAGDLPYTPRNPPANPPDDMRLVENAPPPFPRTGPATPGVALPGPFDEDMAGLGIPPGGALPFAESVGAPPAVQTRPEGMRIGQSLSEGMDLVPEPVANPDMLPPPPDANVGGLDVVNPVEPGADVIEFTPEMLDPALLAGALDLLQQGGLDFQPGDLQLGGRGRTLNPERRNMPRAGGRNTLADELTLEGEGPPPPEPRALPAPAPLRGTESGMVGTPQQFDEMGLGTPGARAAAGSAPLEGELIPAGQSLVDELVGLTDVTPTAAAMPEGPPAATIADELQLAEEPVARTQPATDLGDDGLKLENLPEQRAGDVGIKRTKRPPADMIPRKPLPPNPVVYYSGPARNPTRWLVMEEKGDVWQIRSIDTTVFKRVNKDHTRPPGQELYALVAKDARDLGKTLHSDTDMTKDAIDAMERAVQSGAIVVDDWDNAIAAARAALEKSGGKRISRGASGGEPWFKNIRPGE